MQISVISLIGIYNKTFSPEYVFIYVHWQKFYMYVYMATLALGALIGDNNLMSFSQPSLHSHPSLHMPLASAGGWWEYYPLSIYYIFS